MSLIEINIKNLTKKYKRNRVLENISIRLDNNNYNIIYGVNGIGKTTFIKCLMNFCKYKGTIDFYYTFSFMPEKINLPKFVKLHSFLKIICSINNCKKRESLYYYINLFELNIHLNKYIYQLSHGTLKKIILIKTLIENVDVYIFDEPLNALDQNSINNFKKEIIKLHNERKLIIIISHNINMLGLNKYNLIELQR